MKTTLTTATTLAAIILSAILLASCGDSTSPSTNNFSGTYLVSSVRRAVACSPQQLPNPLVADTMQYARLDASSLGLSSDVQVQQTIANFSITPLDRNGSPLSALALRGTITPGNATAVTSRASAPLLEGARQGGHTFYVSDSSQATTVFSILVLPTDFASAGDTTGPTAMTIGVERFVFHDGGSSGTIFTTCTAFDTSVANRISR